jgi:DUF1365 family protein
MKIGIRLSWLSLRALIEWTALKLWWKGMDYGEARERAATAALGRRAPSDTVAVVSDRAAL